MSKLGRPITATHRQQVVPTESQANKDWGESAEVLLKQQMFALGWRYADLARALAELGIRRSPEVLNRRINRGDFSAGFFLACLEVMRVELILQPKDGPPRDSPDKTRAVESKTNSSGTQEEQKGGWPCLAA